MDIPISKLEAARKIMVRIIQSRTDGADYLDIVLELESQVIRAADKNSKLNSIMSEGA